MHSAASSVWAWALPAVTALVTAPLLARGLGAEGFATYSLATAYLGAAASVGLGRAVVRELSHPTSPEGHEHRRAIVASALWLALGIGVVMTLALAAGAGAVVRSAAGTFATDTPVLRLVALGAIPASVGPVALAVLQGLGRWTLFARLSAGAAMATSIGGATLAWRGAGPAAVVIWLVFASASAAAVGLALARSMLGRTLGRPSRKAVVTLVRLGSQVLGAQVVGALWVLAERVLVSRALGPLGLTGYVVALMLGAYLQAAVTSAAQVITPLANRESAARSRDRLQALYAGATTGILIMCVAGAATIAGAGRPFLELWMGPVIADAAAPALLPLALAFGINGATTAPWFLGEGLGHQRRNLVASVCGALIGIGALALLAPRWGMLGAGGARLAAMALAPVYIRSIEHGTTPPLRGAWQAAIPIVAPAGIALAIGLSAALTRLPTSWPALVATCASGWAAFLAVVWFSGVVTPPIKRELGRWLAGVFAVRRGR